MPEKRGRPVLYWLKRHAAWSMIGAGISLMVIGPVWLKSLNGSSLDWTGSSMIQQWFRQHGPVFAISTAFTAVVAGMTLMAVGIWKFKRAPKRCSGRAPSG